MSTLDCIVTDHEMHATFARVGLGELERLNRVEGLATFLQGVTFRLQHVGKVFGLKFGGSVCFELGEDLEDFVPIAEGTIAPRHPVHRHVLFTRKQQCFSEFA
ncbi:unannotated protein [freshwater metagenome]|uniref:Unannotated protein n=1 Tax=freshwater metagenome TaxID=449393 RepID=A0A6J7DFT3_9ZZZZ